MSSVSMPEDSFLMARTLNSDVVSMAIVLKWLTAARRVARDVHTRVALMPSLRISWKRKSSLLIPASTFEARHEVARLHCS